jgi:hypothetical protein
MSLPSPPALGGPLGDALAGAEPAAAQQLQHLAAPGTDAAAKAAALQAQAEQAPEAQAAAASSGAAEAATANATKDLGNDFSSVAPVGTPGVPCACGECIKKAVDPAAPSLGAIPAMPAVPAAPALPGS